MKWRYILKEIEIKTGERNVESYYRLQYEVLRRIDDGKTDEVKESVSYTHLTLPTTSRV